MRDTPLVRTIPVGPLQCNCSILGDPASGQALVIDPGDEAGRILEALASLRLKPVALLHTHAHFDHVGATRPVAEATGAPIRLHAADFPLYEALPRQAELFGLSAAPPLPPNDPVRDGETIGFGPFAVTAIHTPGHTPGSTCYRLEAPGDEGGLGVLFSGDTLFRRSIGRTDLWGGDTDTILASIRERLYALPDGTPVVCGHGPGTTIAEEKRANPFVRAG